MFYLRFFQARLREFSWLKRPVVLLSLANLVLGATAVGFAYASKLALDTALDGFTSDVVWMAVLLGGLIVFQLAWKTATRLYQASQLAKSRQHLQGHVLEELLDRTLSAFQQRHTGAWMNHLDSDVSQVARGLLELPPQFAFMAFRFVLAFVLLVVLDPVVAISLSVLGLILLSLSVLLRTEMRRRYEKRQEAESDVRSYLQEQLDHMPVIKAYDAGDYTLEHWRERHDTYVQAQIHHQRFAISTSTGLQAMFMVVYALVLMLGAYRISIGLLSVGGLVAILQLAEYMQSPFRIAGSLLPMFYATETSYDRLASIETLPMESPKRVIHTPFQRIIAKNLSFSYTGTSVLHDMTFAIEPGDLVRVLGDSGAGKTTLFYLLLGLLEPESGTLELNMEAGTVPIGPATRSYFAYVPQQIRIVSGTIRENLVYHRTGLSDKDVRNACEIADIDQFVQSLPEGYDTTIGERGLGLSEGQLQRLAIARALLSDAPILLLDEATSALDAESEQRVLANIAALPDKTILFISHRDMSDIHVKQTISCSKHQTTVDE
jgi:ATP-binding cassette subfamily B protein